MNKWSDDISSLKARLTKAGLSEDDLAWFDSIGWRDANVPPATAEQVESYKRREAALNADVGPRRHREGRDSTKQACRRYRRPPRRYSRSRRRRGLSPSDLRLCLFPVRLGNASRKSCVGARKRALGLVIDCIMASGVVHTIMQLQCIARSRACAFFAASMFVTRTTAPESFPSLSHSGPPPILIQRREPSPHR